jgi:hypothetical protein
VKGAGSCHQSSLLILHISWEDFDIRQDRRRGWDDLAGFVGFGYLIAEICILFLNLCLVYQEDLI